MTRVAAIGLGVLVAVSFGGCTTRQTVAINPAADQASTPAPRPPLASEAPATQSGANLRRLAPALLSAAQCQGLMSIARSTLWIAMRRPASNFQQVIRNRPDSRWASQARAILRQIGPPPNLDQTQQNHADDSSDHHADGNWASGPTGRRVISGSR